MLYSKVEKKDDTTVTCRRYMLHYSRELNRRLIVRQRTPNNHQLLALCVYLLMEAWVGGMLGWSDTVYLS
jgi:hypothetical protein